MPAAALRCVLALVLPWTTWAQPPAAVAAAEEVRDDEPNRQDRFDVVEGIEADESALPPFGRGSSLLLRPRTYYLDRNRDQLPDNRGWAAGGSLQYRSGWWLGRVQVGATLFTSQQLLGPEDEDGTQLFKPGPKSFSVLGEAFATARLGVDHGVRLGRQSFDLPYLGRHDTRMVPNTFEALAVGRPADAGFSYVAGYFDGIKRKNDDEFISMSEAAGAAGSDEGLGLLAAQFAFDSGDLIGAMTQVSFDVMSTFFIKAEKSFELTDGVSLRAYAQYTDQRSAGAELLGDFSTHLASVMGELFYPNMSFRLAASKTGAERGIHSPFGGAANYLSIIVGNFDRAGEKAWMIGMSYDFARVDGLSVFGNIATGRTPDGGPVASPDETEYDVTVDYRFASGRADGLWVRLRGAWIDQDENEGGDDYFDFRAIVNYSFDWF